VRLLVDHNISPYIARALAAIAEADGHQVEAKFDKFDGNTSVPDTEWLGLLGNEGGWAFVSDDHRIYRNPQERSAMLAARVIGFFLEPAWRKRNVTEYERAARLILWLPRLAQQCEAVAPPAAYKLPFKHTSLLQPIPLPRR
jgi:PIN like domain